MATTFNQGGTVERGIFPPGLANDPLVDESRMNGHANLKKKQPVNTHGKLPVRIRTCGTENSASRDCVILALAFGGLTIQRIPREVLRISRCKITVRDLNVLIGVVGRDSSRGMRVAII